MKVTASIDNNETIKVFPVITTDSVNIDYGQSSNENKESIKYGNIKVLGKEPLASVTINSFFPTHEYSFNAPGSSADALGYIKWFRNNRTNCKPMRLVIVDENGKSVFNRLMALETFQVSEVDTAGDYHYNMVFEQYRKV